MPSIPATPLFLIPGSALWLGLASHPPHSASAPQRFERPAAAVPSSKGQISCSFDEHPRFFQVVCGPDSGLTVVPGFNSLVPRLLRRV